ncbi:MAG TPA: protein kinase [Capsulimonadaceae bacterium]
MASAGTNNPHPPQLGRYKIVRELARSNDIVYEGFDPTMNRKVAVKELNLPGNLSGAQKRERLERFYREAKAAGTLNHRNIVTIYEIGQDKERHFIAMEFLDGQSLRDYLHINGPLPLNHALQIALDLCDALGYAHTQGVVHRDVKPDNVHLIQPSNTAKLTDFGIARVLEEPSMTSTGQVFGTPSYMSPEQLMARRVDNRTDLFSLGVLLFEIITGKKPFVGDSIAAITYAIMHSPVAFPNGMPAGITGILRRALSKDPEQRYPNAQSMAADIRAELMFQGSAYHKSYINAPTPDPAAAPPIPATAPPAPTPAPVAAATPDATAMAPSAEQAQAPPDDATVAAVMPPLPVPPAFAPTMLADAPAATAPAAPRTATTVQSPQPASATAAARAQAPPPPVSKSIATVAATWIATVAIVGVIVWAVMYGVNTSKIANKKAVAIGHYNAGTIALDGGDAQHAVTEYQAAIKAAPGGDKLADSARRNLGLAYMALGDQVVATDPNAAANYYQQALASDARNAAAHYRLAQVIQDPQTQAKEYEKAVISDKTGRIGMQARKDAAAIYFKLGNAALDNHDADAARSSFNKAIELAPADPIAQEARQRLTSAGL